MISIKGYLPYKIIFCLKVALDVWLMNLDFCVFVKSTNFKIYDAIIGIAT